MPAESKTPTNDPHSPSRKSDQTPKPQGGDHQRIRKEAERETDGDAPMDPQDEDFLKKT